MSSESKRASGLLVQARAVLALAWLNGIVAAIRTPLWVASYLTPPLSILVILSVVAKGSGVAFGVVGGLVMILVHNGLGLMSDAAFYRLYLKFQDLVLTGPMRPWSYALGLALSGLLFSIPGLAVFSLVMGILGIPVSNWPQMLVASVLMWASGAGMGFYGSLFFREMREVWPATAILTFAISVLPPVYYPYTMLPAWARTFSLAIPTASAALLIQDSMGLVAASPLDKAVALSILLVETLAFWLAASRRSS